MHSSTLLTMDGTYLAALLFARQRLYDRAIGIDHMSAAQVSCYQFWKYERGRAAMRVVRAGYLNGIIQNTAQEIERLSQQATQEDIHSIFQRVVELRRQHNEARLELDRLENGG